MAGDVTLTVITPTAHGRADRLALRDRWMRQQTRRPTQDIVVAGGDAFAGAAKHFTQNLLDAIPAATGDVIAIVEDDDYYAPGYLETLLAHLPDSGVMGSPVTRLYHVPERRWTYMHWYLGERTPAPLGSIAFTKDWLPIFWTAVQACHDRNRADVDAAFWGRVPREAWQLQPTAHLVGIKGLSGPPLSRTHEPNPNWSHDPDFVQLKTWIGPDAACYIEGDHG